MKAYVVLHGDETEKQYGVKVFKEKDLAKKFVEVYGGTIDECDFIIFEDELNSIDEYNEFYEYEIGKNNYQKLYISKRLNEHKDKNKKKVLETLSNYVFYDYIKEFISDVLELKIYWEENDEMKKLRIYTKEFWSEEQALITCRILMDKIIAYKKSGFNLKEINKKLNSKK